MRDCAFYIEKALENSNLKNRAELCRILNIKQPSLFTLESGKTNPSEQTLLKLADLAGLPKEEAIIDLGLWRAKNNPELKKIWTRISKMVGCLLLLIICLLPSFSYAANHNIYIMRQIFIM